MKMTVGAIAEIAHEVNRAYCKAIGDNSQPPWDDAPEWQRSSAIDGVLFLAKNSKATPADSHANWCVQKYQDGWKYGPVKDPEKKEHPCLVEYSQLPDEQKTKDALFLAVVRTCLKIHEKG